MRKIMNWVLAVTFICGASVFTSCSANDANDNPSQEQAKKDRKEFVAHTRATLKDLAENLNFSTLQVANTFNQSFNERILNNPDFEKTISTAFFNKALATIKPVETGSELADMGFSEYCTVDLTDFNYRFTAKTADKAFTMEEAENFEVVLYTSNPLTGEAESDNFKLALKPSDGQRYQVVVPASQMEGLAIVVLMPSEMQLIISSKLTGTWIDNMVCTVKNEVSLPAGTNYAQLFLHSWKVSGTIESKIIGSDVFGYNNDQTMFNFSIVNNREDYTGNYAFSWEQNGRKMLDLTLKQGRDAEGGIANIDLSQFTSASSLLDLFAAWLTTRNLDEAKLTLLDDLTTTLSISDMTKALELARASASARRNYADEATIDQYTQQLNALIKADMTCKGVHQQIPMKLVTTKFGVDYWTMPAFNFADENGYVSLVDLLDAESVQYSINIIDHAAGPMQQSIIVVRQLLQYVQGLVSGFQQPQGE